jgi:hypothetical protein
VIDQSGDNNGFESDPGNAHTNGSGVAMDNNSGTNGATSCLQRGKDRHLYYNYNINLPTGATVTGIEVRLDAFADSAANSPFMCLELSWDGGVTWTSTMTTPVLSTSETTHPLGGPANLWGRAWEASDLSNSNFRVRITNIANATARDFSLEWIAVKVYYQP